MTPAFRFIRLSVLILLLCGAAGVHAQPPTRLRSVIRAYLIETGYPAGRPGFVVDHIVPLCAGGRDGPPNLQWQERLASYRKDGFERQLCAEMKRQGLLMIRSPQ